MEEQTIYFRMNGILYRIRVGVRGVWMEQQTPHVMAGNQQMVRVDKDDLWNGNSWNFDLIPALIKEYEGYINGG